MGFIAILFWIAFGIVGLILGRIVEKSGAGFFLGPFGWIIVFLLPRVLETKEVPIAQKTGPSVRTASPDAHNTDPGIRTARPKRDLESDEYKLWLSRTNNIKKNDLFEKYEFDENLFATLADVLKCVDQKDREKKNAIEQAHRKSELKKAKKEEELANTKKEEKLQSAAARYREEIRLRPDTAESHYNLGVTLQELGGIEDAEASFQRAKEVEEENLKASKEFPEF